ncbi:hypothetical protein [Nocardioides daphniae]|uniref:Uncharacterized protein n=1 Tax=Nocardioides daphniae TaxID=402297 RepID=A0A4V1CWC8_9ACTN|nr:hypothetical protein [Nocardioides daphniae]QCC76817.1 hypothetical protein E2C04_05570 [Nocardioides daphniae]GGD16815.1 hypothetical protein GCM10007231_14690 [Nocardioides daphniae]
MARKDEEPKGRPTPPQKGERPGIEEAFRSSGEGPSAAAGFATAGVFVLIALAIGGVVWGAAQLDIPMFPVVLVVIAALFGAFTLLQRSVKD